MNKKGTLYLVPTPIGNMEDITFRAIKVLKETSILFCEDTRITKELLQALSLDYHDKVLISNNDINEKKRELIFLKYIENNNIALLTDRGTPIISDPGFFLVEISLKNNINVVPLPGATAITTALIASGLPPYPFYFHGFLKGNTKKKTLKLEKLKVLDTTLIFYESSHEIEKTIKLLYECLGDRKVVIARELTKIHEEFIRTTLSEAMNLGPLKGEIVILVEGKKEETDFSHLSLEEHVKMYKEEGASDMEAFKKVANDLKTSKSEIYKRYHQK